MRPILFCDSFRLPESCRVTGKMEFRAKKKRKLDASKCESARFSKAAMARGTKRLKQKRTLGVQVMRNRSDILNAYKACVCVCDIIAFSALLEAVANGELIRCVGFFFLIFCIFFLNFLSFDDAGRLIPF